MVFNLLICQIKKNLLQFNFYFLAFDAGKDKPYEVWAEMFKALDENDDERVDIDELRDDMTTILKGETRTPEDLMAETDSNGDGYIDFYGE